MNTTNRDGNRYGRQPASGLITIHITIETL